MAAKPEGDGFDDTGSLWKLLRIIGLVLYFGDESFMAWSKQMRQQKKVEEMVVVIRMVLLRR